MTNTVDNYWSMLYNLCIVDDDCERGMYHDGACGLAVRENFEVVRYIDSEDER